MNRVFIIAEAGVNHNGDTGIALKLCDAAKEAGVDAIKFQTWKTEKIITRNASLAKYQKDNISENDISQFEMLKRLELDYDSFTEIKNHCEKIGIKFLSTPDEKESLDFLLDLGMDIIKVGSGDVTNIPYLRMIGNTKLPVILSTGMSALCDVENAYRILKESGAGDISILHCTTNYPTSMSEVNLLAINTLKAAFNCTVGYSDHTLGIEVPIAAIALGAEIIEKHFTLDKGMEGPDHKASLDPDELKEMVNSIRNIEKALGNGIKVPNKSELLIQDVVKKKIVASEFIAKGEEFSDNNLTVKRVNDGISAAYWDFIIGMKAIHDFNIDDPILIK